MAISTLSPRIHHHKVLVVSKFHYNSNNIVTATRIQSTLQLISNITTHTANPLRCRRLQQHQGIRILTLHNTSDHSLHTLAPRLLPHKASTSSTDSIYMIVQYPLVIRNTPKQLLIRIINPNQVLLLARQFLYQGSLQVLFRNPRVLSTSAHHPPEVLGPSIQISNHHHQSPLHLKYLDYPAHPPPWNHIDFQLVIRIGDHKVKDHKVRENEA